MRFEEVYEWWTASRLIQKEAAMIPGVSARTFRRYIDHYEEAGLDGLIDKRLSLVSHRRDPVDEVMRLADRYLKRHQGWNVKHYMLCRMLNRCLYADTLCNAQENGSVVSNIMLQRT